MCVPITSIVNLSITSQKVPAKLKRAKIKPLYKNNSRLDRGCWSGQASGHFECCVKGGGKSSFRSDTTLSPGLQYFLQILVWFPGDGFHRYFSYSFIKGGDLCLILPNGVFNICDIKRTKSPCNLDC